MVACNGTSLWYRCLHAPGDLSKLLTPYQTSLSLFDARADLLHVARISRSSTVVPFLSLSPVSGILPTSLLISPTIDAFHHPPPLSPSNFPFSGKLKVAGCFLFCTLHSSGHLSLVFFFSCL